MTTLPCIFERPKRVVASHETFSWGRRRPLSWAMTILPAIDVVNLPIREQKIVQRCVCNSEWIFPKFCNLCLCTRPDPGRIQRSPTQLFSMTKTTSASWSQFEAPLERTTLTSEAEIREIFFLSGLVFWYHKWKHCCWSWQCFDCLFHLQSRCLLRKCHRREILFLPFSRTSRLRPRAFSQRKKFQDAPKVKDKAED